MNLLKRSIFAIAHKAGFEISKTPTGVLRLDRHKPLSADPLIVMKTILGREPRRIFDVGANIGQTAQKFAKAYPQAEIHSFEPHPRTFEKMRANTASLPRVRPVQAAVGSKPGEATLFSNVFDQTNSLLPLTANADEFTLTPDYVKPDTTVTVPVITIDDYCAKNGITEIDLLKTDAEGHDLEVIRGAAGFMAKTVVPVIYTEVFFVPVFENQPLFPEIYEYLYKNDYRLVDIYESGKFTHYFHWGGNAMFVHASLGKRPARKRVMKLGRFEMYV